MTEAERRDPDLLAAAPSRRRRIASGSGHSAADVDKVLADFQKMNQIRGRVDKIVEDPAVAESLKPWYRQFCKRPCFHDEYLATFNRPNVELVDTEGRFLSLLRAVAARQAALLAQWMNVGFIHGVMNTDNMTISGESIDFGPCAFMEAYDPQAVFSSIDHNGRYALSNQPLIARWNLARLAETLLPLLAEDAERAVARATEVIDAFPAWYAEDLRRGHRAKLGLQRADAADDASDTALAETFLALLHAGRVDFTSAWRRLADAAAGDEAPLRALFSDPQAPGAWLERWRARVASEDAGVGPIAGAARAARMRAVNPRVIPRNHRVEEALAAASDEGRMAPFEALLDAVRRPFDEADELAPYAEPADSAVTACYRTFCGT
jgi:uncharacterized protein YdiU (UPF0061 family)